MEKDKKFTKIFAGIAFVLAVILAVAGALVGWERWFVVSMITLISLVMIFWGVFLDREKPTEEEVSGRKKQMMACLAESFGWNGRQDLEKAETLLRQAMADGIPEAVPHLYELLWRKSHVVPAEVFQGYSQYIASAFRGQGYQSGISRLTLSARKGYAPAQFELGTLYQHNQYGAPQERKGEAFRWLKAAADQEYMPAIHNLGFLVQQAIVDPEEGDIYTPRVKGTLYYDKDIIVHCALKGHGLIQKAANLGYPPAQHSIGMRYLVGSPDIQGKEMNLFPIDRKEARFWLQEAARQGFRPAVDDYKKYFGEEA